MRWTWRGWTGRRWCRCCGPRSARRSPSGARRVGSRVQWSAGAAFLVGAAIKLVLLDFGSLGQLANILAVIAAGGVFMLVGWLAPMPPARKEQPGRTRRRRPLARSGRRRAQTVVQGMDGDMPPSCSSRTRSADHVAQCGSKDRRRLFRHRRPPVTAGGHDAGAPAAVPWRLQQPVARRAHCCAVAQSRLRPWTSAIIRAARLAGGVATQGLRSWIHVGLAARRSAECVVVKARIGFRGAVWRARGRSSRSRAETARPNVAIAGASHEILDMNR